jgi:hypothetical protein
MHDLSADLKPSGLLIVCRYKLSPIGLSGESYIAKLAEAMFQVRHPCIRACVCLTCTRSSCSSHARSTPVLSRDSATCAGR